VTRQPLDYQQKSADKSAHSKWARFQRTGVPLVSYEFPEFNINLGNFSY